MMFIFKIPPQKKMFLGQISRQKYLHKTGTILWDFQKQSLLQTKNRTRKKSTVMRQPSAAINQQLRAPLPHVPIFGVPVLFEVEIF